MDITGADHMTSAEKSKRKRITTVAAVEPLLLREADAANVIGKSQSWMRQRRLLDIALLRAGKPTVGPAWVQVETSIFYEPAALRAWVETSRIERGQVEWRGRSKGRAPGSDALAGAADISP